MLLYRIRAFSAFEVAGRPSNPVQIDIGYLNTLDSFVNEEIKSITASRPLDEEEVDRFAMLKSMIEMAKRMLDEYPWLIKNLLTSSERESFGWVREFLKHFGVEKETFEQVESEMAGWMKFLRKQEDEETYMWIRSLCKQYEIEGDEDNADAQWLKSLLTRKATPERFTDKERTRLTGLLTKKRPGLFSSNYLD